MAQALLEVLYVIILINNGCKEIYSTTTNLNKVKSDQDYIKFKELDLNNIEKLNLDELFDFDIDYLVLNAGLK